MQPRQYPGIGVEHSQRGEYGIGHAEVQRGSPSGGRQQGQQEQHDHDDLRGEPYMEEQHEVRRQQKEEPRARIERPAGRKMEPKPLVNRVLTSVAMHTIEQGAHQCGDAHHHEVQGRKHADGDEVGDLQFAGFGGLVELVRGFGGRVRCGHDVFRFVCIDNIPLANLTMISRKAIVCL